MVPLRNLEAEARVQDNGLVLIRYEVAVKPWFGRVASRVGLWDGRPMQKQLELDEIGSFVWGLFDERRTVREIVEVFMDRYKVQRREAVLSVTEFIRMLGQRGLVGLR
ncbi:PqqD family protein [Salidesulfovibrio onnuriiensis]|uniref:PqqD family protein n=1 Tax=Salidesulfovibrio onnuriiensis TaxID=2583823 RepID=UPI00202B91AC|nr:PqqD family protein [Salidesulfovibrio onnuriiensis]